jgi:hypothetical protein
MVRANIVRVGAAVALGTMGMVGTLHARELTAKECGDKFLAAVAAGTLKKTTWEQFRKAHCPSASEVDPRAQKEGTGAKK